MRQRIVLLRTAIIIGAAAAVGVWTYFRVQAPSSTADAAEAKRLKFIETATSDAQAAFGKLDVVSIATLHDPQDVRKTLENLGFDQDPATVGGPRDALLQTAGEFIYYCFCNQSCEEYTRWRQSRGDTRIPLATLKASMLVDRIYQNIADKPLPADADESTAFELTWNAAQQFRDGAYLPISMVSERRGLAVVSGLLDAKNPSVRKIISGDLPIEIWRGGTGGSYVNWWKSGLTKDQLIKRDGRIGYCDVGVVLGDAGGRRLPFVMTFFWDPFDATWRVQYVCVYNFTKEAPSVVY